MTVALACSIGLHWSLLQSVAWTTMLLGNLGTASISEAVQRTFDGKHPCCLCWQIAAGKKAEKKPEFTLQLKKFEYLTDARNWLFIAPTHFWHSPEPDFFLTSVENTPPKPPPRSDFA